MGVYKKREEQPSASSSRDVGSGRHVASVQHKLPHMLALQRLNGNRGVQRLIAAGGLKAKFAISAPGDRWEQAADRAADRVVESEPAEAQPSTETPCLQPRPAPPDPGATAVSAAHGTSNGQPLAPHLRATMEHHFEADFSNVRIHTDPAAERLNSALQARAVTHGSDIYFNQGQYQPWDHPGKHLLAHELAHVIQQRGRGGGWLQRTPMPAAEPSPGTEEDVRDFLREMLRFWEDGTDYLRFRTVDRDLLVRLLDSWRRMVDNGWRIIDMRLAGDPALLEQLKTGYRRAVDALITKAARDLRISREDLYAQHNLRIAWWARRDLAPREAIVFILGAGDAFYTAARAFFNFTHARVVGDLRSLSEVRDWLEANPPASGLPWGDVSIVVHANLEGQMMTPVAPDGERVTPDSLHQAIRDNTFRALADRVVDNATRIVIRGCALGRNREILQLLRSAFGGRDESPQIYAPVHLQSYEYQYRRRRRRRRETISAEEYFREFWYVGFPSRPARNQRALARIFAAKYPGVPVNWARMLRTRGATRRQTYSVTFSFEQTNVAPPTAVGQRGRVRRRRQQELARLVRSRFADSRRWRDINETSRDVDDEGAITIRFEARGGNQTFTGSIPDLLPRMRTQADYRALLSQQPGLLEATRPLEENSQLTADDFFWVLRTAHNRGARTFDFRFTGSRTLVRVQRDLVEPDPDRPGHTRRVHPDIDDPAHYGLQLPSNY